MNISQQVRVFDDASLIRDSVTMLCRDRFTGTADAKSPDFKSAVDQLCWDVFALQSKSYSFGMLVDKCSAIINGTKSAALHQIRPQDLANEICSPIGGW